MQERPEEQPHNEQAPARAEGAAAATPPDGPLDGPLAVDVAQAAAAQGDAVATIGAGEGTAATSAGGDAATDDPYAYETQEACSDGSAGDEGGAIQHYESEHSHESGHGAGGDDDDGDEDDDGDDEEQGMKKMTLVEHLEELRMRLIWALLGLAVALGVCLIFGKQILDVIRYPYVAVVGDKARLTALGYIDPFSMYFRVSLYAGTILAAPWIFYHLWMFVSAGLYKKERRYVLMTLPFSAGLFVTGAVFFLFVVSKPMLAFLLGFNDWLGIESIITFQEHVEFVTNMMLVFGVCFQMPLAVLILAKIGIVSMAGLNRYRRHVIVIILIVAAFVTVSPSPIDQLVLAIPMWMLYELGVLLAYFLVEKPRRKQEALDAAG